MKGQKGKSVAERQQQARTMAARCAQELYQRFGAKRVIPFGSAVGDGPWHEASDLDLAVAGLSAQALYEAEKYLETILPAWLEVDLVPLERVYPEVRARILGTRAMAVDPYLALQERLKDELTNLERLAQHLEAALERAGSVPDEFATRALVTYLDDFYKGCERICERVAVTLDDGLPQGERWHQTLLQQMGESGGHSRPPLFDTALLAELDQYRRFRHLVRHIYGYELEAERVQVLASRVPALVVRITTAVERFKTWLTARASGE